MAITASDVAITAGAGTEINTVDVTNGAATDKRQVVAVGGPNTTDLTVIASVLSTQPGASELGLTVREAARGQATMANSMPVTLASDQSTLNVSAVQAPATNTSTINGANQHSTALTVSGYKSWAVDVRGTWTGALIAEVTLDGTNWEQVDLWFETGEAWSNSGIASASTGMWWFEPLGTVKQIRISSTAAAWTGSATIVLIAGMGDMNTPEFAGANGDVPPNNVAYVGGLDATNGLLKPFSVDPSGRQNVILTDGTTAFKVAPASTSPVATDPAVIVSLSPNSNATIPVSQSSTWTVQPGNTQNTTPWLTAQTALATGSLSTFHLVTAASTNATNVKAGAGALYGWYVNNNNAATVYLCFHNTAGTPTAGASVFFKIGIPAGGAANVFTDSGITFSTGIAITTVTTAPDGGSVAVAANDLVINLFFK